jgi:Secretion system C-terminal sorting domain
LPNGGTLATGYKRAARLRRNSQLKIFNSVMIDFQEGLHVDGTTTETNALNNDLKYKNNILAGIVTTSKVLQVNTTANNPSFNIATWYAANNNTTVTSSSGILTAAYNTSNATVYTGLDYRPATGSIAQTGADFTDSSLTPFLANDNFVTNDTFISIYPNPYTSNFKINFTSSSSDDISITTYDNIGRQIETKNTNYNQISSIELGENYQSGIYFVIVSQNKITKSFKIIKN